VQPLTELLHNTDKHFFPQIVTPKQTVKICTHIGNISATFKNYTDRFMWSYVYQPQHALRFIWASTLSSGHRKMPDMCDD